MKFALAALSLAALSSSAYGAAVCRKTDESASLDFCASPWRAGLTPSDNYYSRQDQLDISYADGEAERIFTEAVASGGVLSGESDACKAYVRTLICTTAIHSCVEDFPTVLEDYGPCGADRQGVADHCSRQIPLDEISDVWYTAFIPSSYSDTSGSSRCLLRDWTVPAEQADPSSGSTGGSGSASGGGSSTDDDGSDDDDEDGDEEEKNSAGGVIASGAFAAVVLAAAVL